MLPPRDREEVSRDRRHLLLIDQSRSSRSFSSSIPEVAPPTARGWKPSELSGSERVAGSTLRRACAVSVAVGCEEPLARRYFYYYHDGRGAPRTPRACSRTKADRGGSVSSPIERDTRNHPNLTYKGPLSLMLR